MSENKTTIVLNPGEGTAYSAVGDAYRILAGGDQTGGSYTLMEIRVTPQNGPPPHVHTREDEAFFILEGEVTFQLGGRTVVTQPGGFLQGPRGIPHSFKNTGSSPARILVLVTPSGFEKFIEEFATPLPSFDAPALPVTPTEIEKLLAAAPKYGIQILPPPG